MEIVHSHCAGLDVHKKTVVAAIIVPGPKPSGSQETRTFGTMTVDLLAWSDWLAGPRRDARGDGAYGGVLETGVQPAGE